MFRRTCIPIVGLAAGLPLLMAAAPAGASPRIGDKAPAVRVDEWIAHKPAVLPGEAAAASRVFLLEFFATWDRHSTESIPRLISLHEKHGKDGLIVIGISGSDEPDALRAFNKEAKVPYAIGHDADMKTTEAWSNDIQYFPCAFIVDKSGIVVWRGSPDRDARIMEQVVVDVLEDKFDAEAARNAAAANRKYKKLELDLQAAYTAGDRKAIFRTVDQMIALKPLTLKAWLSKRYFLRTFDRADEVPALDALIEKTFRDSAADLSSIVTFELRKDLAERTPGLMLRCARRLNELAKGRDVETLALLARVQCELGMIDAAIETQTRAVSLAPDEMLDEQRKVLAYYRAARDLARSAAAPSRPRAGASGG